MNFSQFLKEFVPKISTKFKDVNLLSWVLETKGLSDIATVKADLETEFKLFFQDARTYEKLKNINSSSLNLQQMRQLDVLTRLFEQNQVPSEWIENICQKETDLALCYANFRAQIDGIAYSENQIKEILKNEINPQKRIKAWEASKQIGSVLAPKIVELVKLRSDCSLA